MVLHHETKEIAEKAGIKIEHFDVEDILYRDFLNTVEKNTVKSEIVSVYRVKDGAQEYLMYFEKLTGFTKLGNRKTTSRLVGRVKKAVFENAIGTNGEQKVVGVEALEDFYEIPFSQKKLRELLDQRGRVFTMYVLNTTDTLTFRIHDEKAFIESPVDKLLLEGRQGLAQAKAGQE